VSWLIGLPAGFVLYLVLYPRLAPKAVPGTRPRGLISGSLKLLNSRPRRLARRVSGPLALGSFAVAGLVDAAFGRDHDSEVRFAALRVR
jgi:hypothetical protein